MTAESAGNRYSFCRIPCYEDTIADKAFRKRVQMVETLFLKRIAPLLAVNTNDTRHNEGTSATPKICWSNSADLFLENRIKRMGSGLIEYVENKNWYGVNISLDT